MLAGSGILFSGTQAAAADIGTVGPAMWRNWMLLDIFSGTPAAKALICSWWLMQESCLPGHEVLGRRLPLLARGSAAVKAPGQRFNHHVAIDIFKHAMRIVEVWAISDTAAFENERAAGSCVST